MKIIKKSRDIEIRTPETHEELVGGDFGYHMNKIVGRGYVYVPAIGYYKLVEVVNHPIHTDREIKQPVYAYFNAESRDNFFWRKSVD
jgi:hypothetical protein